MNCSTVSTSACMVITPKRAGVVTFASRAIILVFNLLSTKGYKRLGL